MNYKSEEFRHVNYLWDDAVADQLDPVDRLCYRGRLLGADLRITNTGGGSTSSKMMQPDPLTRQQVEIMWINGAGCDLRTGSRSDFASLYLDKLLNLQKLYQQGQNEGVKIGIEDSAAEMYKHCEYGLNPTPSSIDTPLHGFVPGCHIDHTHPISVIAIAASEDQEQLTREVFGDEVAWIPWQRSNFDLGLAMQERVKRSPHLKGLVIGQHGLIDWADGDRACYQLTLSLIEKAARFIEQFDKGDRTFGGQKICAI